MTFWPQRTSPLRPVLLAASLVICAAAAQAQSVALEGVRQNDPDAPVEVTSDQLEVDQLAGTALFTGDVVVIQGELRLAAPRILVEYVLLPDGSLGEEVDQITATGGVLMVTPTEAAESEQAVYYPAREEVVMTGDVLMTQGPNTVSGQRLVFDLVTGQGQVEGRVRTILTPGSEPPQ